MKTKFFLMFASAAMLLAACSKDDIGSGGDDSGVVTDPKGDAWVSIKVVTPSTPASRALNDPPIQNGTKDESRINVIRAIFFTENEVVTEDIELFPDQAGLDQDGQPIGAVGEAFLVLATSKRILLVANPSESFPPAYVTMGGMTYDGINAAIEEEAFKISSPERGFMMTNSKGGLEPSFPDGADKDLELYKTAKQAKDNTLTIHLDRVVAKVRVTIEPNTEYPNHIILEESGWLLNVTNRKYYPVSKRTPTWLEQTTGQFLTPFDKYKKGSYRIDPNYAEQNPVEYNYQYDSWGIGNNWNKSGTSEYCLENTQTENYNQHVYTTHVLFKIKFIPGEYPVPDGPASTEQESSGDWIRLFGGNYTYSTLMEWIEAELTYKYSQPEPEDILTPYSNALNEYLKGVDLAQVDLNTYNVSAIMANFREKQSEIETLSRRGCTVGDLSYYAEGFNYYKAMIRHDDTNEALNELGEFGVVRNSVYDILVRAINKPGYPEIPTPGEEPDEEEGNYLSVQIKVNPWTWYSQEEEF